MSDQSPVSNNSPEDKSKAKIVIGLTVAFLDFLATGALMFLIIASANPFALFLIGSSVIIANPLIAALVPVSIMVLVYVIFNRLSALFSKNLSYRKGLLWGLILFSVLIVVAGMQIADTFKTTSGNYKAILQDGGLVDCSQIKVIDEGSLGQKNYCLEKLAVKNKDASLCGLITGELPSVIPSKSRCYRDVGMDSMSAAVCAKVSYEVDFDDCLAHIAKQAVRPSLCHGLKDVDRRAECYFKVIEIAKDPVLYKRFCPFTAVATRKTLLGTCANQWGPDVIRPSRGSEDELKNMKEYYDRAFAELSK